MKRYMTIVVIALAVLTIGGVVKAASGYLTGQTPTINDVVVCTPPSGTHGVQRLGVVHGADDTYIYFQAVLEESYSPAGGSQWYPAVATDLTTWQPQYCRKVY